SLDASCGPPNPVPALSALSPSSAVAASASFALTVTGANFVSGSTVSFNGAAHTTTFVSSTQLRATIATTEIVLPGNYPVTVSNPAPGGGLSAALTFTVTTPTVPVYLGVASTASPGGIQITNRDI